MLASPSISLMGKKLPSAGRRVEGLAWSRGRLLQETSWTMSYEAITETGEAAQLVLKVARSDLRTQRDREFARSLILRELQVCAEVRHSNLVAMIAAHEDGDEPWVVQPIGESMPIGETLPDASLTLKFWTIRQIAQGLIALHAAGWLYGCLQPAAIRVSPSGHALLVNLGWCRRLGSPECQAEATSFVGHVRYAAPEMFCEQTTISAAADIYSLGALLVELVSGCRFLEQLSGPELIAAKRLLEPREIAQIGGDVPYRVQSLVQRMLAREALRRPSAADVVEALIAAEIECFSGGSAAA